MSQLGALMRGSCSLAVLKPLGHSSLRLLPQGGLGTALSPSLLSSLCSSSSSR